MHGRGRKIASEVAVLCVEVWRQSPFQTTPKKYNFDFFRTGPCPCRRSAPKEETTRSGASDAPSGRARHGGRTRADTVSVSVSSRDANMHGHTCRIWGRRSDMPEKYYFSPTLYAVEGIPRFLDGFLGVSPVPVMKIFRPRVVDVHTGWCLMYLYSRNIGTVFSLPIIILSKRNVDRSSDKKNYSILSAFFSARWKNFSALPTLVVSCYVNCHVMELLMCFSASLFSLAPQDIVFPRVTRNSRLGRLTFSKTEETLAREKHSEDGRIFSLCAWVKCRFWMFFWFF